MKKSQLREVIRTLVREEVPNCIPDEDLPDDYDPLEDDPCQDGWSMLGMKAESRLNEDAYSDMLDRLDRASHQSERVDIAYDVAEQYLGFEQMIKEFITGASVEYLEGLMDTLFRHYGLQDMSELNRRYENALSGYSTYRDLQNLLYDIVFDYSFFRDKEEVFSLMLKQMSGDDLNAELSSIIRNYL